MYIGWWFYLQVMRTTNHYLLSSNFFSSQVVGTLKPSVEVNSLPFCSPFVPFTPSLLPLHPLQVVDTPGGGDPKTLFSLHPLHSHHPFNCPSLLCSLCPLHSPHPLCPFTPLCLLCSIHPLHSLHSPLPLHVPFCSPSLPLLLLCPHMW